MRIAGSAQKTIALFVAAFLLCGVLHVGLYGLFFAVCITQLYAGAVTESRLRTTGSYTRR